MSSKHAKPVINSAETRSRPFDVETVRQAGALVPRYEIRVEAAQHGFVGTVNSMPTVFGCGRSRESALSNARDHLKWALAYLIETGRTPMPDR